MEHGEGYNREIEGINQEKVQGECEEGKEVEQVVDMGEVNFEKEFCEGEPMIPQVYKERYEKYYRQFIDVENDENWEIAVNKQNY